ncbi:hypothetical protein E2C01_037894 [Portunus trituberculatus]|uniref:Uncharacterized protein n=1 Tax=Portunus trituberculatus TaxID=210409 RepID=A0A5B7FFT5_PORTR|nr:hypothetical protein [Portunus trituberculatus]
MLDLSGAARYTAGSVRPAAASRARAMAVPVAHIMAKAGWSQETTFAKHYDKLASAPPSLFPELTLMLVIFFAPPNCRTDRPGQGPVTTVEGTDGLLGPSSSLSEERRATLEGGWAWPSLGEARERRRAPLSITPTQRTTPEKEAISA